MYLFLSLSLSSLSSLSSVCSLSFSLTHPLLQGFSAAASSQSSHSRADWALRAQAGTLFL